MDLTIVRNKEFIIVLIITLVLAIYIFPYLIDVIFFKPPPHMSDEELLHYTMKEHTHLELHIHPILEIYILGEKNPIPENIGIDENGMRVIHTHEEPDKIHIESPQPHTFKLRDFFTIWGKNFNRSCIFNYCEDESHALKFYVDGKENAEYENLNLTDGEQIKISYELKK